jgi:hypothetical protein
MTDHEPEPPQDGTAPAGELVLAEEGGVRVFYISAPTMPDLVDRLALVLGEHMHDDDELHVTYNPCKTAGKNTRLARAPSSRRHSQAGLSCTSNTARSSSSAPATIPIRTVANERPRAVAALQAPEATGLHWHAVVKRTAWMRCSLDTRVPVCSSPSASVHRCSKDLLGASPSAFRR